MRPNAQERVQCFDAANGKVLWSFSYDVSYPDWVFTPEPGMGPAATPIVWDNKLCTLGDKSDLVRAQLTSDGYQEISRTHLVEPTYPYAGRKVAWPPPAYANRCVFARNDRELICASLAAVP